MDSFINWFFQNMVPVVLYVIIGSAVVFYIHNNRKGLLAKAALYAVSKAEETWGSNTGRIKFAEVYAYLHKQFPIVAFFFTEEQITSIIEDALSQMKTILAVKAARDKYVSMDDVDNSK